MSPKSKVQSPKSKTDDRRPKTKIAVTCLFISLGIFACTNGSARHYEFNIAESKSYEASLFRQNCAICHGHEANGKEMDGRLIPSLRYGEAATLTEEQIYMQIHDGKLPMPSFKGQLSEKEIRGIVEFIMYDLQNREKSKTGK